MVDRENRMEGLNVFALRHLNPDKITKIGEDKYKIVTEETFEFDGEEITKGKEKIEAEITAMTERISVLQQTLDKLTELENGE